MANYIEQIIETGTLGELRDLEAQLGALVAMSATGAGPKVTKFAPIYLRRSQRKIAVLEGLDT